MLFLNKEIGGGGVATKEFLNPAASERGLGSFSVRASSRRPFTIGLRRKFALSLFIDLANS